MWHTFIVLFKGTAYIADSMKHILDQAIVTYHVTFSPREFSNNIQYFNEDALR